MDQNPENNTPMNVEPFIKPLPYLEPLTDMKSLPSDIRFTSSEDLEFPTPHPSIPNINKIQSSSKLGGNVSSYINPTTIPALCKKDSWANYPKPLADNETRAKNTSIDRKDGQYASFITDDPLMHELTRSWCEAIWCV